MTCRRQSSRRPTLPNRPTNNWLESNNPSLHQIQGESLHRQTYSGNLRWPSRLDPFLGIDNCMLHMADLCRVPGVGPLVLPRSSRWGAVKWAFVSDLTAV